MTYHRVEKKDLNVQQVQILILNAYINFKREQARLDLQKKGEGKSNVSFFWASSSSLHQFLFTPLSTSKP